MISGGVPAAACTRYFCESQSKVGSTLIVTFGFLVVNVLAIFSKIGWPASPMACAKRRVIASELTGALVAAAGAAVAAGAAPVPLVAAAAGACVGATTVGCCAACGAAPQAARNPPTAPVLT